MTHLESEFVGAIFAAMGARGFEEDELRGCAHGTPRSLCLQRKLSFAFGKPYDNCVYG